MDHPHEHPCLLQAWEAHEPELRGFLVARTGDPVVADELLSEVFLRALRSGDRFCAVGHVRGWLFTTARNLVIDRGRTEKVTVPVTDALPAPTEERRPVDLLAGCLPRALSELEPRDADVLVRCDLEGLLQADYAKEQGLSLPGAKARVQRARRRLRAHLVRHCRVQLDDSGAVCCFVPRDGPPAEKSTP